jgi:RNA polymerase sigma-70 factor, ECF subfamily
LKSRSIKYTEEELVALLKQNSEQGFSYLYDHYSGALYGVIFRMIQDEDRANDLMQDVFVKIWKNIDKYNEGKGRLYTWMLNIARNSCIDNLRLVENKVNIQNLENTVYEIDRQEAVSIGLDETGIHEFMQRLKPERKQLLDMAYFEGYTQEEIAEKLGLPLGTVKTRIRAALQELRDYFKVISIIIILFLLN